MFCSHLTSIKVHLFVFPTCWLWAYLMKTIFQRHVHCYITDVLSYCVLFTFNFYKGIFICLSNLLIVSVPDEGYSRDASCALHFISTFLLRGQAFLQIWFNLYGVVFLFCLSFCSRNCVLITTRLGVNWKRFNDYVW